MDEKQFEKEIPVKRLRRELAYEGTILKVYKDYVDANGVHAVWDYIHHDGAAAVLPVTDEGKILMVRQYRNALDRFTLEIPAGKVDSADEPRRICAFRELEEETGFRVDKPEDLEFLIRIDTTVAFLDEEMEWKIEKGEIEVQVGASSEDIRLKDSFRISADRYISSRDRAFAAEARIHQA